MIMVVHHHPGMDAPAGLLTRFAQRLQPQLAVTLVVVDIPPLVAPRHDVVTGPGILEAYLECHQRFPDPIHPSVNPPCRFPGLTVSSGAQRDSYVGLAGGAVKVKDTARWIK